MNSDYKITITCFCYKGDEEVLPYCLKAADNAFKDRDLKICVIDDHTAPISEEMVERLQKELTCEFLYEQSTFNRNHNLNGKECIYAMVDEFIRHSKGREGLLIKLDPDTMILKPDIFDEFMANDSTEYMASTRPGCHFSGICYCIKTELLEGGKRALDNLYIPLDKGPEDYIIGLAMSCASLPRLSEMITVYAGANNVKTSAVGWNYAMDDLVNGSEMYYKMFEIVTYGNWFIHPGLTRLDRCKPMEKMLAVQESNL